MSIFDDPAIIPGTTLDQRLLGPWEPAASMKHEHCGLVLTVGCAWGEHGWEWVIECAPYKVRGRYVA